MSLLFDTKEKMICTLNAWDSKTFSDALSEISITENNKESIELLKVVLDKQNLFDKKMNGYASENLKKDEFEQMGAAYVDFFNKLEKTGVFWTPLDFLHEVCKNNLSRRTFYDKKAKKYEITFEEVTWLMCGRALRALPSFIREYQLRNALQIEFNNAMFDQSEDLDRKFHCDVKMTLDDVDYYVWSFISSAKSIFNFVDKFKGNRYGCVMNGNHILCPFDRKKENKASYKGWAFYSKDYINEIRSAIYQKAYIGYDDIDCGVHFKVKSFKRPVVVKKYASVA